MWLHQTVWWSNLFSDISNLPTYDFIALVDPESGSINNIR